MSKRIRFTGSRGERLDPATRAYRDFCRKLRRVDLARERAEAPGAYALRVAARRPDLAGEVDSITRLYDALIYRSQESEEGLDLLKQQVKRFRPGKVVVATGEGSGPLQQGSGEP